MQPDGRSTATDQQSPEPNVPDWARSTPQFPVRLGDRDMEVLPGTPFQHYLLPIEYMPSRDLRSRWGFSQPPHPGLTALFRRDEDLARRMIAELREYHPQFQQIPLQFQPETGQPGWMGGAMNPMDLAFTYFFVAKYRPRHYVEIGSGQSTLFARRAVTNHGLATRIISIDPQPRNEVDRACDEIVRDGLETLPSLSIFESLQAGDIVFLDGSHRSFMNSDVTVFMLDVMPRLQPGVLIHIHDINLPQDYAPIFRHWYWNEQYIVGVWLIAAPEKVQILMPCAFVSQHPHLASELTPPRGLESIAAGWNSGGSLWFTKV